MKKIKYFMSLKEAACRLARAARVLARWNGKAPARGLKERARLKVPLALLIVSLAGCANVHPQGAPARAALPGSAGAAAELERAQGLIGRAQWPQADALLRPLLVGRQFGELDPTQQHLAVSLAALAALQSHDARRALSLSERACAMPGNDARDWFTRVRAATIIGEPKEAVQALSTLATLWPQVLARLPDYEPIETVMRNSADAVSDAERYELLAALHKIKFLDEPRGAGEWWREFTLLQLARGERMSAAQTLARISDPYVIISIEADRRFDALRAEPGTLVSVQQAAEESIQSELRYAQLTPDRLEPMNHLAEILISCVRAQQALSVTDAAIEQQDQHGRGAWSDYDPQYRQILSNRANALYILGRYQAAVGQLDAASRLGTNPGANTDELINLAAMYNDLEQPQEAEQTLARVALEELNPYGLMQMQKERLRAALARHDDKGAALRLEFLRSHRQDALSAYQEALLYMQRDDEGAALLITRLREPRLRSAALLAVQSYAEDAEPASVLATEARWRRLIQRADVQQAITSVGRIAQYPLLQGSY